MIKPYTGFIAALLSLLLIADLYARQAVPIFDVHSHYKSEEALVLSPVDLLAILDRENIERMVIVGEPSGRALTLYQFAPERFVPFLGLYRSYHEKADWMLNADLPARLREQLETGEYAGIGEVHIFAPQKNNRVFRQVVQLASEYDLPLLLHGDPQVVEQAFQWFPQITVIWAHLGTIPDPAIISDMLSRFPDNLYVDTSVRDERFESDGMLKPEWYSFFVENADRVLAAVDTYSLQRWQGVNEVTERMRHWLAQLPASVQARIAHGNARKIFAVNP